jgi:hypothetical protein
MGRGIEEGLHIACVQALRLMSPMTLFWHVPNGGRRSEREAATFKRMGVRPGVPDLEIIQLDGRPIWVEFKASKGRVSDAQTRFALLVGELGLRVEIIRSVGEFAALIDQLKADGKIL